MSLEGYIKDVEGITTRSQGFQNQFQFANSIGKYRVRGIDLLINKQFDNISTWLSYSLAKNDYTFSDLNNGDDFPNNVDIRHAITFAGTYTYDRLKIALGLNWRTGKPFTSPDDNQPVANNIINYDLPNDENLDDYLRVDLSATYRFNLGAQSNALLGVSIWNLFDRTNTINRYYSVRDNNSLSQIENRALGFTPNVSFRVEF